MSRDPFPTLNEALQEILLIYQKTQAAASIKEPELSPVKACEMMFHVARAAVRKTDPATIERLRAKTARNLAIYNAAPHNEIKRRARAYFKFALRSGNIVKKPCEKCGREPAEGHHPDYSKPLEVKWLCVECHGLEHRKACCHVGHPLSGPNLYIQKSTGYRGCKKCRALAAARCRQAKKMSAHKSQILGAT